jgi:hypothetical protein
MNAQSRTNLGATLAGIFVFVIWGLGLILGEIPHEWEWMTRISSVFYTFLLVAPIFIFPIFMCLGWIRGFPRWSYPYVGHVIVFSLYISNATTPGFKLFGYEMFGRELWSWRAWIPFLVVVLIALAVTRSVKPIGKFFTNIWNDWTLLTFSFFGFMPLLVAIAFDEMDRLFSLYFMVILALVMVVAAWYYLRAGTQRGRVIALLTGVGLTTAIAVIVPTLYWQRNGWVNPTGMAITGGLVMLFMFWPALIGLVHHLVAVQRKPNVMA